MTPKQRYQVYLRSPDWQRKRRLKFSRVEWCAICGSSEHLQVHHLFYRRDLRSTKQGDLRLLCDRCHKLGHELIAARKVKINLSHVYKDPQQCFDILRNGVLEAIGTPLRSAKRIWLENVAAEKQNFELDEQFSRLVNADK